MGGKEVEPSTPKDIAKYLNDLCAYALSIGMTLEEYWHGEPKYINYYAKAYDIKRREKNTELWLQGAYIYNALACVSPMFNSLAKDHKPKPYLKEPVALSKEEDEERKYQRFKSQLMSLVKKDEGGK